MRDKMHMPPNDPKGPDGPGDPMGPSDPGDQAPPPFRLIPPRGTPTPLVFAVPHSGRYYPPSLIKASRLDAHSLRLCEDAFVDQLMGDAPALGGALLVATHGRAYVDLNRAANELDAAMFSPALDGPDIHHSHRVKAGLGTIPRQVAEGMPIYDRPLPAREAFHRLEAVHHPYHEKLRALLNARRNQFGHAVLIDCHSMPSDTLDGRRRGRKAPSEPDIVLGDCWGTAAWRDLSGLADDMLVRAGFSVRRNVPYSGGYVTQHYSSPGTGFHVLQIEINRAIYMDEASVTPSADFADVRARLARFVKDFIQGLPNCLPRALPHAGQMPRAAE